MKTLRHHLKIYQLLAKIWLQDLLTYRVNLVLNTFKYGWYIFMMVFVWLAVADQNPEFIYSQAELINYYVIAAIIFGYSNHWLNNIEQDIKLGQISKFLVKPLPVTGIYYLQALVKTVVESIFKLGSMGVIIWLLGYQLNLEWSALPVVIPLLGLVHVVSFLTLYGIALMTFWFQEVYSVRYAASFLARFFSGLIVPLALLPASLQNIIWWLPYQDYASTPIRLLLGELPMVEVWPRFLILFSWLIILTLIVRTIWHQATHAYESTGI